MAVPEEVVRLVEQFREESRTVQSPKYKEAWVRRDYLDPLFTALGWDVAYEHRGTQMFREVILEDTLKVEGVTKAPDYCFYIRNDRKFFVEAKKPSVNLMDGRAAAFQVRRYAWSAKLPLSVLTDFEELAIYDCRTRPEQDDKASTARSLYMRYEEYLDRWEEIASLFSKEAVLAGSLDAYVQESRKKRGVAPVDQEFLKEMEGWREMLAKDLALRNPTLARRELNYAVQMTIDRIVFLRICEDRGIEDHGTLEALLGKGKVYDKLCDAFKEADKRYNSGLFHFHEEKGRSGLPDDLTMHLELSDQPLKQIIKGLYYPESPYEFSVMPVEIMGQVYEQFLGKVINLNENHRVVIEDKPEVKKAGGVYYTPSYIVEYIVKNTVGKLIDGKTPEEVSKLRILDPACGSGSFLIGAYDYLLEWHRRWYVDNGTRKHAKLLYEGLNGEWQLSSVEKKRILLNNIYGVDIDPQAVEVTKLSLLLKVLEGETHESVNSQLTFFRERALPDLDNNIKWGNSLIGPDFYNDQQTTIFSDEERYRINVFDWRSEFPRIMRKGGFDAIIGNPPYVRIHNLVDYYPEEVRYIQRTYATAEYGKIDIYIPFIEQCSSLLHSRGRLGFIVSSRFLQTDYGRGIRELLRDKRLLAELVDFRCAQVFEEASTYTCLLFASGASNEMFVGAFNTRNDPPQRFLFEAPHEELPIHMLPDTPWSLTYSWEAAILRKVEVRGTPLPDLTELMLTGVKTGANKVFTFELVESGESTSLVRPEGKDFDVELENTLLRPYSKSESLKRYLHSPTNRMLLYPYVLEGSKTKLIPGHVLRRDYPQTWTYLTANRRSLEQRQKGKLKGPNWYGLSFASSLRMFSSLKLVTPTLATVNSFSVYGEQFFPQGAGGGCGMVLKPGHSIYYVLGVLNSRLLTFYFHRIGTCFQGGYFAYEPNYLNRIPMREIDFENPRDVTIYEQLEELAKSNIQYHEQLLTAKTSNRRLLLTRSIAFADQQIDHLVYELYGLSEEEISIVES